MARTYVFRAVSADLYRPPRPLYREGIMVSTSATRRACTVTMKLASTCRRSCWLASINCRRACTPWTLGGMATSFACAMYLINVKSKSLGGNLRCSSINLNIFTILSRHTKMSVSNVRQVPGSLKILLGGSDTTPKHTQHTSSTHRQIKNYVSAHTYYTSDLSKTILYSFLHSFLYSPLAHTHAQHTSSTHRQSKKPSPCTPAK